VFAFAVFFLERDAAAALDGSLVRNDRALILSGHLGMPEMTKIMPEMSIFVDFVPSYALWNSPMTITVRITF
jgi:hypothetical protein